MTNILKGDSSAEITLAVAQGCDYSGKTLHVEYQGARRSFFGVAAGGTVSFAFSAKETASMSLGAYPLRVWLESANGDRITIHNAAVRIRVTDDPVEVHGDSDAVYLDARGALYGIDGLPARFTDNDLKAKIDEIVRRLGGTVALLLACALPAFGTGPLTVQTAPKGEIYNDQPVVTNVTFDASGITTDLTPATNYTDSATNELLTILTRPFGESGSVEVGAAGHAGEATSAYYADTLRDKHAINRMSADILEQLDAATTTNAQQTAAIATIPRIEESLVYPGAARYAEDAYSADTAQMAQEAAYAGWASALAGSNYSPRQGDEILAKLDAATTASQVTNIVRDLSLGGIWDSTLQVWWTPRMVNGSLTYHATTNVNLNAEN